MITLYNSIIDSRSWGSNIPQSIMTARDYYKHVDPRRFFALIAPINQILISLCIILFWKQSILLRYYFSASFVIYVLILFLTIFYFVPRDIILFSSDGNQSSPEKLTEVLKQWQTMNWVRSLLGLIGIAFTIKGLDKIYDLRL